MAKATKAQKVIIEKRIALIRRMRDQFVREQEFASIREEELHYTDAPQYADKYYGSVMRETTKHDNSWD